MLTFTHAWQVDYLGWLDSFPLTILPVANHVPVPLHHHFSYWELVIIAEGRGQHLVGKETFALEAGDVLVLPKGVAHGYQHCRELGLINIIFDPKRLELPERELAQVTSFSSLFAFAAHRRGSSDARRHLRVDAATLSSLVETSSTMHAELLAKRTGFELITKGLFCSLLVELARQESGVVETLLPESHARLTGALDWVEEHYAEPISVELMVQKAHVSRSTLERLFQNCFGTSPLNYVLRLRMQKAKLLLAGTVPISEIGALVGIRDPSYFTRVFRRQTGILPKDYRACLPQAPVRTTPPHPAVRESSFLLKGEGSLTAPSKLRRLG